MNQAPSTKYGGAFVFQKHSLNANYLLNIPIIVRLIVLYYFRFDSFRDDNHLEYFVV